jgi:hypothetical protein
MGYRAGVINYISYNYSIMESSNKQVTVPPPDKRQPANPGKSEPDSDSEKPSSPAAKNSSNKGQGPAGENL